MSSATGGQRIPWQHMLNTLGPISSQKEGGGRRPFVD